IMSDLGYQGIKGLQSNGLTNPFLKWEETKKLQVGLDIGFLQDRILLNTNYTRNRSSNQLLEIGLPLLTGFQFVPNNLPAIVQNTSWEFNLNTINIKKKDFTWSTNLNLTIPENKLVSFPELATSAFASLLIVGQSINVVQLYKFIGVNESTGNYQFMDSKGNLTTDPNPVTDRIRIVNTTPQFYGGFHNSFTYKGVQLDVSFQFVKQIAKQDIQLGLSSPPGTFQNILGNQPIWVLDRWQKSGDKAPIEQYHYSDALSFPLWFNTINNSDALWVDASFLKLRNVSISWQLPDQWKKKIRLQGCRLFIHGQNLLTITPFKGLDPEIKSSTYLPPLRKITIGAQIVL
ncbi:MAG TPA: hypothetical protein VM802_08655, partial [Chitinophaga sp.]|nr:hypothetical protein [Chitinophaga sp.]